MPVIIDTREGDDRSNLRHVDSECPELMKGVPKPNRKKVPNTQRIKNATERCEPCFTADAKRTESKRAAAKEREKNGEAAAS